MSDCQHDWQPRGVAGDRWRECFLCGTQEDTRECGFMGCGEAECEPVCTGWSRRDFNRDPAALAWARSGVESTARRYDRFAALAAARGDMERKEAWERVAALLRKDLIGTGEGCVISVFDGRRASFNTTEER